MEESDSAGAGSAGSPSLDDIRNLREQLTASERRAAALAELTAVISEGRDPLALVQRGVELTARLTQSDGAFVYLWDKEAELLVLRAATDGHQRAHLGRVRLRMGEGVTGWVALMRQTVVLPEAPYADPRFKPFPELRENAFKSMVAVPIVAPGADVLGVFTLYSTKPNAFLPTDVSLASEVGALLANGLVQAETIARLKVQSAATQFLRNLPETAWGSLEQCLNVMATQCATDLDADICIIEVTTDRSQPHAGTQGIALSDTFRRDSADIVPPHLTRMSVARLVDDAGLHRLRIPLGAASPIGAVTVYRSRRFNSDDEALLEGVGAQIAAGALSLYGNERVRPLLDQLFAAPDPGTTEAILRRHGWKPRPAWVALFRITTDTAHELRVPDDERVRAVLTDVFGDRTDNFLLLGAESRFVALAWGDLAAREVLAGRLKNLSGQPAIQLAAGISPIANDPVELFHALRHAQYCQYWAELAWPKTGGVVKYEDVAHLRLLPYSALERSTEVRSVVDSLTKIVRYDLENGTDLAQTLDVFLTYSGSAAKASSELFIHRNTLRQRIQRVEDLIGQSAEKFDDWVTAGVAVRLVRRSEEEIEAAGMDAPRCPLGVLTNGDDCCGIASNCAHWSKGAQSHRGGAR